MNKHETKYCPRCAATFECMAGSINRCQCSGIQLTPDESTYLESEYDDCLCLNCLNFLQQECRFLKEKNNY